MNNNKTIAKNTLYLYFRMMVIIAINLFAVRIILKVLGIEDYGIYNVVGGIVTLFSFWVLLCLPEPNAFLLMR